MERTLCIQVLGAVGSGKTQLLALITTLLRKEGVLIVGSGSETVCAESVQVKFDAETHESGDRVLTGYTQMDVYYDDDSKLSIKLANKTVRLEEGVYVVYSNDNVNARSRYEVGSRGVTVITVN